MVVGWNQRRMRVLPRSESRRGVDRLNLGLHGLRGFWCVFWGNMSVIDGKSAPHNALKVLLKVLLKVTVKVTLKMP